MARSTHLEKLVTDQLNNRISNLENGVNVIDNNAVTNAALADMAAGTVKGNLGGSAADPTDVTLADLSAALIADTETGNDDLWSAQKIANEINLAASSSLKYKGGYDAAANSPDLDTSPSGIATGSTYTITTNGTFFTEEVQIGDFLIAEVDNPTTLEDWTIVNSNIGEASTTTKGLVELATDGEATAGVVVQGNDSRLSNSRLPTGNAGGDLTGSYPNPTLADGVVTGNKLADGGVDLFKLEDIPSQTLLGNNTGAGSAPIPLTPTQIRSLINVEDNATGDQNASEVPFTPGSTGISATNVQALGEELDGRLDSLEGVTHDPVTVPASGLQGEYPLQLNDQFLTINTVTADVPDAGINGRNGVMLSSDKQKLDSIEAGAKGDQTAVEVPLAEITGVSANNVQAAILELNSDIESNDSDITALDSRVDDLEDNTHVKAVSGNAGISVDEGTQAVSAVVSSTANNKLSIDANGLFVNQTAADVSFTDTNAELGSTNVQGALDELAKDAYSSKIARVTVSGPYTFPAKGPKYLHFVVNADMTGTLPSSPIIGQHYVIKNSASSSSTITVNSVAVIPGDIYEIIYDGTEWVEY